MKRFFLPVLFVLVSALVSAAAPCSDYYSPSAVSTANFFTNKPSYSPGEEVRASLDARESFGLPLADVSPLVLVFRGEDLVDAFFLPAFSMRRTAPRQSLFPGASRRIP